MQDIVGFVLIAFGFLLLFFTLTVVVRPTWAAVAFILVLLTIPSFGSPSPMIAVPVALFSMALLPFTLLKVGVLALIVVTFTGPMLDHYPTTFDFGAWYALYGWMPVACVLGLAVYASRNGHRGSADLPRIAAERLIDLHLQRDCRLAAVSHAPRTLRDG